MALGLGINEWLSVITLVGMAIGFLTLWIKFGQGIGALQSALANGLKSIEAQMTSYGLLLGAIATKKIFNASEMQAIQQPFFEHSRRAIDDLLQQIKPSSNPINAQELEKLKAYVARAQRGESLNLDEAKEFFELAKKLESEKPYQTSVGTVMLVALAAFVLGMVLGGKNK